MPDEVRLLGSVALSLAAALALAPVAVRLARRTDFMDRPVGYKGHGQPTPYLGGVAVMAAFAIAAVLFGGGGSRFEAIVLCALGLFAVGTIDDRVGLGPGIRLLAEGAAAVALWEAGLGWDVFASHTANLLLTVLWIVAIVNAFNLMDNMDGAGGTVAAVSASGVALLAIVEGDVVLAALSAGVAGACAGFLPYNLAQPSRIFLGDGGSMPIGFAIAAAIMAVPLDSDLGLVAVLAVAPLVGLPILDTTLVLISRARRRVLIWSGARDHLTHRLRSRLTSARAVALILALAQSGLCLLGVGLSQAASSSVIVAALTYTLAAAATIWVLELPWRPSVPSASRASAPARQESPG